MPTAAAPLQTRRITRSRPNAATNQTVNNENKVTVAANARTALKKNVSKGSVGEKEPLKATKNPLQAVQLKRQALDDKTKVGAANSHVVKPVLAKPVLQRRTTRISNEESAQLIRDADKGVPLQRNASQTKRSAAKQDLDYQMKRQRTSSDVGNEENLAPSPREHMLADVDEVLQQERFEQSQRAVHQTSAFIKDKGWDDLDECDGDDPLMVREYVHDVYNYLKVLEIKTLPNPNYMSQQKELHWNMRGVLIDWMIDIHNRFRLLPETLFLAVNLIDRFLSLRVVSMVKLQLVGMAALFIASKYEEVLCPSVENLLFAADGGFSDHEILKAEAYMLQVLNFDLSFPNPINFLRRISKADDYDVNSRTLAKFFIEISCVDHRLLGHAPSVLAAAGVWLARRILASGDWNANLVHYSGYSEPELLPTAQAMLNYILREGNPKSMSFRHEHFFKKYSSKKYMRAAVHIRRWVAASYPDGIKSDHDLTSDVKDRWAMEGREWQDVPDGVEYRP